MMAPSHSWLVRTLARFGFGLGVVSVVAQYIVFQPLFRQMGMGPISSGFGMLMFFTILTNLMMVVVYWSSLARSPQKTAAFFNRAGVQTAVAAYIALVAIVYVTVIRGQLPLTPPMVVVDALLHYVAPVVYLGWWWLLPAKQAISYASIPRWLMWPIIYLVFIMMAGLSSGNFIYPILDVNKLGVIIVAFNIALLLALLTALSAGLVLAAKTQASRKNAPANR
jgi:hypothetical protein